MKKINKTLLIQWAEEIIDDFKIVHKEKNAEDLFMEVIEENYDIPMNIWNNMECLLRL